ncbi:MAG: TMEM14 family protein [Candidatus Omnitrophica bacterium]|nr:TMEM14 family protein [Candidatus Omnitrophota bacterium]
MSLPVTIVAAYGAFSIVGGIIGYVKAKSAASLLAGVASGSLLLLCAYGMAQGLRAPVLASLGIALALGARFLGTWLKNHRLMPDLLMVLFSALTAIAAGSVLLP